jgi:N-hydroxyarylamine O-acetyltransferase
MDVPRYLQRIGYRGSLERDYQTLRDLQVAHLYSVPFENLDVHLGVPITLELEALFDKIVVRRRGGFCYELNGLFAWLLGEIGFNVTLLSASDAHADGSFGPEYDHLTLEVSGSGDPTEPWLADVGWGDSFNEPLRLVPGDLQEQGGRAYRIDREGDYYLLWQRDYDGTWERQYHFTLQPRRFSDFTEMCVYHQTSPKSLFVRKRICTLATAAGRVTLDEARLITTVHGERSESTVTDETEYRRILEERFGVVL